MMFFFLQNKKLLFVLLSMVCLALPSFCFAQEQVQEQIQMQENLQSTKVKGVNKGVNIEPAINLTPGQGIENIVRRIELVKPEVSPNQISSLFFTTWEQNLLADARRGLVARPPTDYEVEQSQQEKKSGTAPPRGPRELSLGGIVFVSSGEWTIWLNNQKITPERLPHEILDIRVRKDYIQLKWFDAYTNQIFPIKLKTHQRFNIDTRIFLPG